MFSKQRTLKRFALVVDANRTFRHFALRAAQRLGCAAVGLRDAEEALQWLACNASVMPAVITIDPALRGIDGFTLCQRIRGNGTTCAVPVIFASSLVDIEDNVRALDVGADEFLPKPVHPELYVDAVARWLAGPPREITLELSLDLAFP